MPILKEEALKSYRHKSMAIVEKNQAAIDRTIELLQEIPVPSKWATIEVPKRTSTATTQFVREIVEPINRQEGNQLSVVPSYEIK